MLATVEQLRQALGPKASGYSDEVLTERLVAASADVEDYCRRPFSFGQETGRFRNLCNQGSVILSRTPILEILEIRLGGNPIDLIAVKSLDFSVTSGVLSWCGGWSTHLLEVDYRGGWALPGDDLGLVPKLPANISLMVAAIAADGLLNPATSVAIRSKTTEGVGSVSYRDQVASDGGFPAAIAAKLRRLRP